MHTNMPFIYQKSILFHSKKKSFSEIIFLVYGQKYGAPNEYIIP